MPRTAKPSRFEKRTSGALEEGVSIDTLSRIFEVLHCNVGDIVDFVTDNAYTMRVCDEIDDVLKSFPSTS